MQTIDNYFWYLRQRIEALLQKGSFVLGGSGERAVTENISTKSFDQGFSYQNNDLGKTAWPSLDCFFIKKKDDVYITALSNKNWVRNI